MEDAERIQALAARSSGAESEKENCCHVSTEVALKKATIKRMKMNIVKCG